MLSLSKHDAPSTLSLCDTCAVLSPSDRCRQPSKTTRALAFNQRFQRFSDKRVLLADPRQGFGFGEKIVIEGKRDAHNALGIK